MEQRTSFEPGTPGTVTMIISSWANRPSRPLPESGAFALAIGVPVPFEEYPFPSPPSELTPLYGLRLAPGENATITVVPERMTGEWAVSLYYPPEPE